MQLAILITFIIFGTSLAVPPRISKKYRDYEYNRYTDAFYKLHIENTYAHKARRKCHTEFAELMVPSTSKDIEQMHEMLKQFPDIGDLVYVGQDGQNHESAEEKNIINLEPSSSEQHEFDIDFLVGCEVYDRQRNVFETTLCHYNHPFICKVEAKDAPYDETCDVYAKDYEIFYNAKSCYKLFSPSYYSWEEAYSVCRAENAHLLVLNSETESHTVAEFVKKNTASLRLPPRFLFVGIRANRPTDGTPRVFRTIFNQTLEEAGFNEWMDGEPNNSQGSEYCGSIHRESGKYNDLNCLHLYDFICEKEINLTSGV